MLPTGFTSVSTFLQLHNTVWLEILARNLFWRIGGFESNPPIFPSAKVTYCYVTSSICCPPSFKMSARKLQTSKEWNENSPDLVYHQLFPASFDVLWFETDPAVFTLLTVPVCYILPFCYEYNYGIRFTQPPK